MKRKKWTEEEEQTLLSKYSELLNSGTLEKLKTRQKKFSPIADQVNSIHHLTDPIKFPFRWTWRDVSIKVQNMRHQYIGVKHKIRVSNEDFNWSDGENHWQNFLKYKEVFGDVEVESKHQNKSLDENVFSYEDFVSDDLGLGLGPDCEDLEVEEDDPEVTVVTNNRALVAIEKEVEDDPRNVHTKKQKKSVELGGKNLGFLSRQIADLREMSLRFEEKRREREFTREMDSIERNRKRIAREGGNEKRSRKREEMFRNLEVQREELVQFMRRELERRSRDSEEGKERRKKMEQKKQEEEMEWRERMLNMQIDHEKRMMQIQADAVQNQMQMLNVFLRFFCQFFGSGNDAIASMNSQILQNLQHSGGLVGDNGKPDTNPGAHFM